MTRLMIFCLVAALAFNANAQQPAQPAISIEHVSVVNVRDGSIAQDQTVVIEAGRISAVGPAESAKAPAGATSLDGRGKYLIPGLWDMHVHAAWEGMDTLFASLFVANGVTGVRDMFGNMDIIKGWKENYNSAAPWPRMVGAGHILDGPKPFWPGSASATTAEDARRLVDSLHKAGADFIKAYGGLPHDAYMAAVDEAAKVGTYVVGHVPDAVTVTEASEAGQRSVEHLNGVALECSAKSDSLRAQRAAVSQDPAGNMMAEIGRQIPRVLATQDSARLAQLCATLVKNHTWQVPTLVVLRSIASLDDSTFISDPRVKYMPKEISSYWDPKNDFRFKSWTAENWANSKKMFRRNMEIVGKLYHAGVPFMAGTDVLNPYCFPGFSLHDELSLFVEAGLTPAEALRTATWNPAEFLGLTDSMGTVESGKRADLVLLDANPLVDIHNTQKINCVIRNGYLHDRAALHAMLKTSE